MLRIVVLSAALLLFCWLAPLNSRADALAVTLLVGEIAWAVKCRFSAIKKSSPMNNTEK